MKTGIIYIHTCVVTQKSYVGQTVLTIQERLNKHLKNKKNHKFINALNKYGIEKFESQIIEEVQENMLDEREIYWIKYYNTYNNGYNMTEGGDGFTSEQRKKWVKENYNKHIANMKKNGLLDNKGDKNGFSGKSHSEETKIKAVSNRKENNNGYYHPKGNRSAKNFIFISPDRIEYKVFNSASKFCKEHNINVKIFQRFPNQIIERGNSKGWKRIEII